MFKYISEILKQFSSTQKLIVLIVLLISIVSITYVEKITKEPEELTAIVTTQRKQILEDQRYINYLNFKVKDLSDSIVYLNGDCNKRFINLQKEYSQEMLEQQVYVNNMIKEIKNILKNRENTINNSKFAKITTTDSIFTAHSPIIEVQEYNSNDEIISILNKIKNKINQ